MSTPPKDEQRFIIRKYVMARSAKEAIEKDATTPVQDVFVDEKEASHSRADAIGYKYIPEPE